MRAIAAEALLLALSYVGAALIASAILDWIAVEHLRVELLDHPWCTGAREWAALRGSGWRAPEHRALLALVGVGTIFGAAAFVLVRIRRYAVPLLVASAVAVLLSLLLPIAEALVMPWPLPVREDPTTGELWLHPGREYVVRHVDVTAWAAWTLPALIIALGAAAARYAARWGTPAARAWSTAAALVVPFVGACVLAVLLLGTSHLVGHTHWSWPQLHGWARAVMVAGGVAVALVAAPAIRRARSWSPPRLLPALLLVAIGAAIYAWAAPLRRIHGDSPPPRHQPSALGVRDLLLSSPWDFPRTPAPCSDRDDPFMRTWIVRVDDRGGLRLRAGYAIHEATAEAVKALLRDEPVHYRRHGLVLLVDARARVEALAPILELLAGPEVAQVRVAGLVVDRVPWIDAEILTWDACAFGLLRTEAIVARRFDIDLTWGELVDDPDLVSIEEPR